MDKTEIKAMSRRWRRHKVRGRVAYILLIISEMNALGIEAQIKLTNYLRRSTPRRYLCGYHCFVLILLRTLHYSVWHFVRDLSLGEFLSLQNTGDPIEEELGIFPNSFYLYIIWRWISTYTYKIEVHSMVERYNANPKRLNSGLAKQIK